MGIRIFEVIIKCIFLLSKFLSLTEEDLNKFESLTMGAKKKLKTQLELEK